MRAAGADQGSRGASLTPWRVPRPPGRLSSRSLSDDARRGIRHRGRPSAGRPHGHRRRVPALEWNARAQPTWIPVGESFLVSVLLASAPMQPSLLSTWRCHHRGRRRHGWVTTVNAGLCRRRHDPSPPSPPGPWTAVRRRVLESPVGGHRHGSGPARQLAVAVHAGRRSPRGALRHRQPARCPSCTPWPVAAPSGSTASQLAGELKTALRAATGADASAVFIHGRRSDRSDLVVRRPRPRPVATASVRRDPRSRPCELHGGEQRLGPSC